MFIGFLSDILTEHSAVVLSLNHVSEQHRLNWMYTV